MNGPDRAEMAGRLVLRVAAVSLLAVGCVNVTLAVTASVAWPWYVAAMCLIAALLAVEPTINPSSSVSGGQIRPEIEQRPYPAWVCDSNASQQERPLQ